MAVDARLVPVPGSPALVIEPADRTHPRTVVIADLHLGIGGTRAHPEGPPEGFARRLADDLVGIVKTAQADTVLIAGDAKHPIVGTPAPLRPVVFGFFAQVLGEGIPVELVLGNHDVGIVSHLPREVAVHPSGGVLREGVGVFHGHRWPSKELLSARQLIAGHLHPGFRLAPTPDDPEGKRRCWVRVELPASPPPSRRRRGRAEMAARELVIVPAFHPLAGVEALNRNRPARGRSFLYQRFLLRGMPRAYLLDGTDLGPLPRPPVPSAPSLEGPEARRVP